jgi:hypothetical protein
MSYIFVSLERSQLPPYGSYCLLAVKAALAVESPSHHPYICHHVFVMMMIDDGRDRLDGTVAL